MVAVTGVGSWPGTDTTEAHTQLVGELGGIKGPGSANVSAIVHVAELPERGSGADMIGRSAALLTDMPIDREPYGWRLAGAPGIDMRRALSYLDDDVLAFAVAVHGSSAPVKTQIVGPHTLAANLWLPRGQRATSDRGARRDIVQSLAHSVAEHVGVLRRHVPDAPVILQLDEPSLPDVLSGRLPTVSGLGRLVPVDVHEVQQGMREVADAARAAGAHQVVVHCCADAVPWNVLTDGGVDAVSVDTTTFGAHGWESVAALVESGMSLWSGVSSLTAGDDIVSWWRQVGLPAEALDDVTLTPSCGLAYRSWADAQAALHEVGVAAVTVSCAAQE